MVFHVAMKTGVRFMPDRKKTAKVLLAEALKEKMCHKPLDKITVREITEECGVNRQTFYYHFEDIYDLLKWVYQQEIILLMKKQEVVKTWQDALLVLLDYLTLNHDFCLNTLNSVGYRNLRRFFYQDVNSIVRLLQPQGDDDRCPDTDFSDFLAHFYTVSLGTLMESWLLGEIDKTPQQIIEYLEKIIPVSKEPRQK
mgnify:FL=1